MGQVLAFPQQQQHVFKVSHCAGCQEKIKGDYWEVTVPVGATILEHIALCDDCNEETMQLGIFN